MTDITELAQSLKAEAEKATPGKWMRSSVLFNSITNIANPMEQGNKPHVANTSEKRDAEFIALANPANILALVEALEKAQQHIARQEKIILNQDESLSIRRGELEKAQAQSSKWLEAYHKAVSIGARYEERIAELESRTVTVKLPEVYGYLRENDGQIQISIGAERPSDRSGGYATPWFAIYTAAGIKVEAE